MAGLRDKLPLLLGAKTAKALATALDIETVSDLLRHYPRRYAERGELTDIAGLELGEHATVLARVEKVSKRRMKSRNGTILDMVITDGKRRLTWAFFNQAWREKDLVPGKTGLFAGKVSAFRDTLQLTNPEYELFEADREAEAMDDFLAAIIPVYPAAQGMPTWSIAKCVRQVLDVLEADDDPMPAELRRLHRLSDLDTALHGIHRPDNWAHLEASKKRLKWDEAMAVQLIFAQRRHSAISRPAKANPHVSGGLMDAFDKRLPFDLTAGQRGIGEEIATDLASEHPMNRLLQGEVGSGKTIVALRAMLQVVDNGRQTAMLAPTEVLASQHARSLREMLGDLGQAGELGAAENATKVTLLTGSMGAKERKKALLEIVSGEAGIVVGTHALIQDHVEFADLGLAVVDEQHRFGVEQRDALRTRGAGNTSPHVLVMTATPIPRTVAMTVYGDLEVSALREMPVGRSPISTTVVPVAEKRAWFERIWQSVGEEVGKGHQASVVCPRIGDEPPSDKSDKRPPLAVLEVAPELENGPLQGLKIGVLHGRMPPDDKDAVMRAFSAGKLDVLVATTVIEVGVNVPNATAMVIMDADRFGVSQLHQLRGRVGRGSNPGVCLLVTEMPEASPARQRLNAVAATLDGFELSRIDLEQRREGDVLGQAQSGARTSLRVLSVIDDEEIIAEAREEATTLVAADPELTRLTGLRTALDALLDEEKEQYLEKG